MAEPATIAVFGLTAGGLTLFGVVTGLHPALLLAGLAGGWWALSYREPMTLPARIASVAISAIVAAWGAPVALALLAAFSWWPVAAHDVMHFPVAMILGRLTHTIFGASLDTLVKRKLEGV